MVLDAEGEKYIPIILLVLLLPCCHLMASWEAFDIRRNNSGSSPGSREMGRRVERKKGQKPADSQSSGHGRRLWQRFGSLQPEPKAWGQRVSWQPMNCFSSFQQEGSCLPPFDYSSPMFQASKGRSTESLMDQLGRTEHQRPGADVGLIEQETGGQQGLLWVSVHALTKAKLIALLLLICFGSVAGIVSLAC